MTEMIETSIFRAAMSRLGAAVNIITTNGPAGRYGMTASAVCSVSDSPASLLACVNRSAQINPVIANNGLLCVNVLSGDHEDLSGIFANSSVPMDERFKTADWSPLASGVPALHGALCNFACRVENVTEFGTHSVFFCTIEELRIREDGEGLIYFARGYHRLPMATVA